MILLVRKVLMMTKHCLVTNELLGDSLMAEVAIRNYKNTLSENDQLIVVVGPEPYTPIFEGNPYIDTLIKANDDQIKALRAKYHLPGISKYKNKNGELEFACNLNSSAAFSWCSRNPSMKRVDGKIQTQIPHLSLGFCKQLNVGLDKLKYDLFLTEDEKKEGEDYLKQYKKPVILVGALSRSCTSRSDKPWEKDLPPNKMVSEKVWKEVVKQLSPDFEIIFLAAKNEPLLEVDTTWIVGMPIRQVASLQRLAALNIVIDSGLAHSSAAVDGNILAIYAAVPESMIGTYHTLGKYDKVDKSIDGRITPNAIGNVTPEEIIQKARKLIKND